MYADRDFSIAGMVNNSAMTDLKTLAEELCKRYASVPSFLLSAAMALVHISVSIILNIIAKGFSKNRMHSNAFKSKYIFI